MGARRSSRIRPTSGTAGRVPGSPAWAQAGAPVTFPATKRPARRGGRPRISMGVAGLVAFSSVAVGAGLGRALVTTYLPVLLERIQDAPGLIGTVMLVNTAAGFLVPLVVGVWSDRLRDGG